MDWVTPRRSQSWRYSPEVYGWGSLYIGVEHHAVDGPAAGGDRHLEREIQILAGPDYAITVRHGQASPLAPVRHEM